ncbi:MAG: extracellular solute-binding protein, partial [Cellulomonadaceae bacterium]|nr:extracellular solute-binding protein [Cellulomonadaceae bacterium]
MTITYGLWAEEFRPAFQEAADAFHAANPDITVELQLTPFNDYFTKLTTEISSNTAPDLFWLQNIHINLYAKNGALADLTSYREASDVDLSGIPDSLMEPYIIDGKQYAMPWQALPFGLYYNKALFAAAGVADPTNDWTWDDVA